MQENIIQVILEKKLELLTTIANTSMLWWVSSVVFCAGLLGTIWSRKAEIRVLPFRKSLGFLLYFFFASIVIYGLLVFIVVAVEFHDVRLLLEQLNAPIGLYNAEFMWILIGMLIGTSSFLIFFVVWHLLWYSIRRN